MRIKKKNLVFMIILLLTITLMLPKNLIKNINILQLLLFFITGTIAIIKLINEFKKNAFSLNIMHWLFVLFFFIIAPIIQIASNFHPWNIFQQSNEITKIQILILAWILAYLIGNFFANKKETKYINKRINYNSYKEKTSKKECIFLLTVLNIIAGLIIIKNVGLSNLFARSTAIYTYDGNNTKMMSLLIYNGARALIVYITSRILILYQNKKTSITVFVINILILFVTCFPTGLARNAAGTIYLGLFIIFNYKNIDKFKNSYKFILLFIITFIILFPAINVFRRTEFSQVNIINTIQNVIINIKDNYNSEDYDAFAIIGEVNKYTKLQDYTYGKQLVSSVLFFIPRAIWKNKAYGSGQTVFTFFNAKYTNVSCPLVAEGYINFGIIGVVLFAYITGYITTIIDRKYWIEILDNEKKGNYLTTLYPYLLGSYFFMLRGDLMSTLAFMSAYIIIFYIISITIKAK